MPLTTVNPGLLDSQAQYTGFKNRIINGAMMIDQRNAGASQSVSSGAYTIDRWRATTIGSAVTGQRVAGSGDMKYNYRFTGAAGVSNIFFETRIESLNCYDLAGSTVTLSFSVANSTLTTLLWYADYANSVDSFSSTTNFAQSSVTINSTMTRYSVTFNVPANGANGIAITLAVGAQTSGTWTIGNVQLEKGSTATSFDYRPYGTELALCQRYYYKIIQASSGAYIPLSGLCNATTAVRATALFPVAMRVTPTSVDTTGTAANYGIVAGSGSAITCNSVPSLNDSTPYGGVLSLAVASGLTIGQVVIVYSLAANTFIGWSAEL